MKVESLSAVLIGVLTAFSADAQIGSKPKAGPTAAPTPATVAPRLSPENPGTMKEVRASVEKLRKESEAAQAGQPGKPIFHLTTVMEKFFIRAVHLGESRTISAQTKIIVDLWFSVPGRRSEGAESFAKEYKIADGTTEFWLPAHTRLIEWLPTEIPKGEKLVYEIVWIGGRYEPSGFEDVFLINGFRIVKPTSD